MVHCSSSFVAPFVPMSPFVAKRLAGYMVHEWGYRMLPAALVAAVVHKRYSPDFLSEVVDKVQPVAVVSRRYSLRYSLQIELVERAQIVIVESRV